MKSINTVLYIYTETPMHVGTGSGLGAVDMPIQREKHTQYPLIQASGVKGALRDTAEIRLGRDTDEGKTNITAIFGAASGNAGEDHAGAMSPSDARILCFPTRALKGVFVWITSPIVLERYKQETGQTLSIDIPQFDDNDDDPTVLTSSTQTLVNQQVMLEEFTYKAKQDDIANAWATHLAEKLYPDGGYWHNRLKSHLIILPDSEFRDFVRYSTDIVTRIHIDDTKKTVMDGQLFTQELLPADSLLYSVVNITDSRSKHKMGASDVFAALKDAIKTRIQIGADETVGRGRVLLSWQEVE
jgi:CRISPR-associated protein Cmr4